MNPRPPNEAMLTADPPFKPPASSPPHQYLIRCPCPALKHPPNQLSIPSLSLRSQLSSLVTGICHLDSRMIWPAVLATSYGVAEVCCGEATVGAQDPNPGLLHVKKHARPRVLVIVDPWLRNAISTTINLQVSHGVQSSLISRRAEVAMQRLQYLSVIARYKRASLLDRLLRGER